jgi:hypothetical protein
MDARDAWRVPGYVAEELVGFGAAGEVWRGRSLRTGATVALKRLALGDIGDGSRLRRQVALLGTVEHPHLLGVRAVVVAAGAGVLVLEYAAGGSLAVLLRRRGRLRPGEVVSVLAPVAAALACAHAAGLSHGAVTPPNVLFTVDGRPVLADLGVAALAVARPGRESAFPGPAASQGSPPGPADDVLRLAVMAGYALTGRPSEPDSAGGAPGTAVRAQLAGLDPAVPPGLVRALCRALSVSPADRGTAADLALGLRASCQPEPVRLADTGPTRQPAPVQAAARPAVARPPGGAAAAPRPTGPRHRWQEPAGRRAGGRRAGGRRALVRWVGGIGVVLLAAGGGVAWAVASPADRPAALASAPAPTGASPAGPSPAGSASARAGGPSGGAGPAPSQPSSVAVPVPTADWFAVLDRLDAVRARAYELGDVALLRRVYVAGPHLAADIGQLHRIVVAGSTVRGVRHRLRAVSVLDRRPASIRLRVAQSLPESVRVGPGQAVVAIPGTAERAVDVELILTRDGWRLA